MPFEGFSNILTVTYASYLWKESPLIRLSYFKDDLRISLLE